MNIVYVGVIILRQRVAGISFLKSGNAKPVAPTASICGSSINLYRGSRDPGYSIPFSGRRIFANKLILYVLQMKWRALLVVGWLLVGYRCKYFLIFRSGCSIHLVAQHLRQSAILFFILFSNIDIQSLSHKSNTPQIIIYSVLSSRRNIIETDLHSLIILMNVVVLEVPGVWPRGQRDWSNSGAN